jgi:hypothetical protein
MKCDRCGSEGLLSTVAGPDGASADLCAACLMCGPSEMGAESLPVLLSVIREKDEEIERLRATIFRQRHDGSCPCCIAGDAPARKHKTETCPECGGTGSAVVAYETARRQCETQAARISDLKNALSWIANIKRLTVAEARSHAEAALRDAGMEE